jgi:hypothetical protein
MENNSRVVTQTVTYTYDALNRWIGENITAYSGGVATCCQPIEMSPVLRQ